MSEPPPVRVLLACASGRKLRKTGARTGENLSRPVLEAAGAQLRGHDARTPCVEGSGRLQCCSLMERGSCCSGRCCGRGLQACN
ncbi:hypothetical protein DUNSADRAFT_4759 [Dunaliella salina]|uniref:Encoded protein n=1 Tax=Dunaliella salina TaxID=3046 RepID=A0ABQ7FUP1_DUNSA|nr:hypothetical protein DUNSADRAFT_4759 [Dunaliella salina]|eukprot:KAF5826119.1 hypothetical protein DUNSADRAFT_4759 [Dunaliella salina]